MNTAAGKPKISLLVVALVLVMLAMVGYLAFSFYSMSGGGSDKASASRAAASDMRAGSYRLSDLSARASGGDAGALKDLSQLVQELDARWDELRMDSVFVGLQPDVAAFDSIWNDTKKDIQIILAADKDALALSGMVRVYRGNQEALQAGLTELVELLMARRVAGSTLAAVQELRWRVERIGRNVEKLAAGGYSLEAADQYKRDAALVDRIMAALESGDAALGINRLIPSDAREKLDSVKQLFGLTPVAAEAHYKAAEQVLLAQQASAALEGRNPALLEHVALLTDPVLARGVSRGLESPQMALYAGLFLVVGLSLLGLTFYLGTRERLKTTAEANKANQDAIGQLLDEIEGLGEGDLTVEASVTEGITSAIADAINLNVEQLRELVSRIVDTAGNLSSSTGAARATVMQAAELSEHQAEEIAGASAAINEMAVTIDQVSANAAESAAVAEKSVSIANKGAEIVRSTMSGMDGIREQIQDTSKRIKRLGESSQEIGDIVSLINDIADQTNILALNAAIQASMAGEAGRGFAVVADEVQRLAERSANATKQIAALVKTIQTDTNEAVASMEQTTSEVVSGASLAQDAGVALSEIETVSSNLAELIQDISTAARHQSVTAGHISKTMNVIQGITTKSLDGTNRTAASVGELADMAVELRESVAGFKLPGDSAVRTQQALTGKVEDRAKPVFSAAPAAALAGTAAAPTALSPIKEEPASREGPSETPAALFETKSPAETPAQEPVFDDSELEEAFAEVDATPKSVKPAADTQRFKDVLAEQSVALDEIDYLSERAMQDAEENDLEATLAEAESTLLNVQAASLDDDLGLMDDSFAEELEAELASIDLDEFDLELDEPSSVRS